MEPFNDLKGGLVLLEPFLNRYDFKFDNYEDLKHPGGNFTLAKYQFGNKKFILGYRFSVGYIIYQFDNFIVNHDFYLNKLGYSGKTQFRDNQTNNKRLAFENILNDFDYLVEDYFAGDCKMLKEYSKLPENIITEYDRRAREGYNLKFDEMRIEQARHEFRIKDYKKSFNIYESVEYNALINDLDRKIIEFCKRHL